jgi:hypothetical protein
MKRYTDVFGQYVAFLQMLVEMLSGKCGDQKKIWAHGLCAQMKVDEDNLRRMLVVAQDPRLALAKLSTRTMGVEGWSPGFEGLGVSLLDGMKILSAMKKMSVNLTNLTEIYKIEGLLPLYKECGYFSGVIVNPAMGIMPDLCEEETLKVQAFDTTTPMSIQPEAFKMGEFNRMQVTMVDDFQFKKGDPLTTAPRCCAS